MKHIFKTARPHRRLGQEYGVATLLSAVSLLFLAVMFIFAVSRTSIIEQRMAGNEVRSKLALEAAQAGLDAAYTYLTSDSKGFVRGTPDANGYVQADDYSATASFNKATLDNGSHYTYGFCDPTVAIPEGTPIDSLCPGPTKRPSTTFCVPIEKSAAKNNLAYSSTPMVMACGWSDDDLGVRVIRQSIGTTGGMGNPPENPLTSKGAANFGGNATIVNYFTNLTSWSGAGFDPGGSGNTFIRNPEIPPPTTSNPPPAEPNTCSTSSDYVCVTKAGSMGPDIIDNDPTLSSLTEPELFKNYTGYSLDDYKNIPIADIVTTNSADVAGARGKSIVITGSPDVSLTGNIGTRENPVTLIIDGNLKLTGNTTIFGIVYVKGTLFQGGGNVTIQGAAIAGGSVDPSGAGGGSFKVVFDPLGINRAANNTGRAGWTPGSWRDWR